MSAKLLKFPGRSQNLDLICEAPPLAAEWRRRWLLELKHLLAHAEAGEDCAGYILEAAQHLVRLGPPTKPGAA